MLILSRKEGENIQIGDDITITFFETQGQKTRIGIDAPRSIKVYRQEILDRTPTKSNSYDDEV